MPDSTAIVAQNAAKPESRLSNTQNCKLYRNGFGLKFVRYGQAGQLKGKLRTVSP
ncbi:hypothetical protein [Sphingorhabdus sp. Alg239-R122]|uniref:hypothetical protein n=1 Tax=Sphingorhabdus sp. Alg239-R122 TaxID=2305989 RepID=UPI001967849D|nr:hypothetical protein [Sphingorhabdus sp. Alg239-R122]